MAVSVVPGAEPFTADGGDVGVLLIHGFTGSSASILPWARHLAAAGYTVAVPRLPGHGTNWRDLNRTRWPQWYGEVHRALDDLHGRCSRVAVGGLSMGGGLAVLLAEERPDDVDALLLVNPAIALRRRDLALVPLLKWVVPALPGITDDVRAPGVSEGGYDRTPLKALDSQRQMWRRIVARLGEVRAPLLMFRSDVDHVVDDLSTTLLMDRTHASEIELVRLHDSYHVATLDHDAPEIFARSADFLHTVLGGPVGAAGAPRTSPDGGGSDGR